MKYFNSTLLSEQAYKCLITKHTSLPAHAADKAVRVVRPPQGGHHLPSDVLVAAITLGPVEALEVLCTDVLARVVEETWTHQITAAHYIYRERGREKQLDQLSFIRTQCLTLPK